MNLEVVNLSDICRICLYKYDNMRYLLENTAEVAELIGKMALLANFEIEINETFPCYLCSYCESKLNSFYEFQQLCQKSNEMILGCVSTNLAIEVDVEPLKPQIDEEVKITIDNVEVKVEDAKIPVEIGKKTKTNQTMRLAQYSVEDVKRAINKIRNRSPKHTTCIICDFIARDNRSLSTHMTRIHTEEKKTWCNHCNLQYEFLDDHVRSSHAASAKLACEFCDKVMTSVSHIIEHLRCHTNERPFMCSNCGKSFVSTRHLRVHHKTHTNEKTFSCFQCKKKFLQLHSLKNHLKAHMKDIKCKKCEKRFRSRKLYKSHTCLKKGEVENVDEGLDTKNVEMIMDVLNNGFKKANTFCESCNKNVKNLDTHNEKFHLPGNQTEKSFLCMSCGKVFKVKSKLDIHMRLHTGELPYKCQFCDKRISTRNQLVIHERCHTGERPYVCNICGKAFAQSSVLKTHTKLHTGRTEECSICLKRFCRPSMLKLHMRQHTGEKPYSCTVCGQRFKQNSHLKEHQRVHSEERPYKCSFCDKRFKHSGSLKSHVNTHLDKETTWGLVDEVGEDREAGCDFEFVRDV